MVPEIDSYGKIICHLDSYANTVLCAMFWQIQNASQFAITIGFRVCFKPDVWGMLSSEASSFSTALPPPQSSFHFQPTPPPEGGLAPVWPPAPWTYLQQCTLQQPHAHFAESWLACCQTGLTSFEPVPFLAGITEEWCLKLWIWAKQVGRIKQTGQTGSKYTYTERVSYIERAAAKFLVHVGWTKLKQTAFLWN